MKLLRCFTILFAFLAFSACQVNETGATEKPYFDLTGFFNTEIQRLNGDSVQVLKTSNLNGKTDEHKYLWLDWNKELQLFLKSDINKSAYAGKYQIDTLISDSVNDIKSVYYAATETKLRTQQIIVSWKGENVSSIKITNRTRDFFTSEDEELWYVPAEGYVIQSSAQNKFTGPNDIGIKGEFITPQSKKYFE